MAKPNRHEDSEIRNFLDLNKYVRVLKLATTPDLDEFLDVAKIAGLGVILIGFIGYTIYILMSLLPM